MTRSIAVAQIAAVFALLLSAACASAPPPKAPEWTSIPPVVLDSLCSRLKVEAMIAADTSITVVATTQPLVSSSSLRAVGHLFGQDAEVSSLAQLINTNLPPMPLDIKNTHSCSWSSVKKLDPTAHSDLMVLELSSPFLNPFAKKESGLMARYSVGGHDAQWYWVPLAERNGIWVVGTVLPTDARD